MAKLVVIDTSGSCKSFTKGTPKFIPLNSTFEVHFDKEDGTPSAKINDVDNLRYEVMADPTYGRMYYYKKTNLGVCITSSGGDCGKVASIPNAEMINYNECPTSTKKCRILWHKDISSNLMYQYDGGDVDVADSITFRAIYDRNGVTYYSETFNVNMCMDKPMSPPTNTINSMYIWECGVGTFNKNDSNSDIDNNPTNHIKGVNSNTLTGYKGKPVFWEMVSMPQPALGVLYYNGNPINSLATDIAQTDIDAGKLEFRYNCDPESPLAADKSITFKAKSYIYKPTNVPLYSSEVTITIVVKKVPTPKVVKNGKLEFYSSEPYKSGCITTSKLYAITEGKSDANITITINSLPTNGKLYYKDDGAEPSTNIAGFTELTVPYTFPEENLKKSCYLLYVFDESKNHPLDNDQPDWTDSFDWFGRDTTTTMITNTVSFPILVKKTKNEKPTITSNPITIGCDNISGTVVFKSNGTSPTLKITDPDDPTMSDPGHYEITVVSIPSHGTLELKGVPLNSGDKFTYKDVITNTDVVYKHDGSTDLTDAFTLSVSDSKQVSQNAILTNNVDIDYTVTVAVCVQEPTVTTGCIEVKIPDQRDVKTVIPKTLDSTNIFVISDPRSFDGDFEFKITSAPTNGGKLYNGDTAIPLNSWVPYSIVASNNYKYQPDTTLDESKDADREKTIDNFKFKVRNKKDTTKEWGDYTQCVKITWGEKPTPPFRDVSNCLGLRMPDQTGREQQINQTTITLKSNMADSKSGMFHVKVLTLPEYGLLRVNGSPMNSLNDTWFPFHGWNGNTYMSSTPFSYTPQAGIPVTVTKDAFKFIIKDDYGRINDNNGEGLTYCVVFSWPRDDISVTIKCVDIKSPSEFNIPFPITEKITAKTSLNSSLQMKFQLPDPLIATLNINGGPADAGTWYDYPATSLELILLDVPPTPKSVFKVKFRPSYATTEDFPTKDFCVNLINDPPPDAPTVEHTCLNVDMVSVKKWNLSNNEIIVYTGEKTDEQPEFEIQVTELPLGKLEINGIVLTEKIVNENTWFVFPDPTLITYTPLESFDSSITEDPFKFIVREKTANGNAKPTEEHSFCINLTWPTPPDPEDDPVAEQFVVSVSCLTIELPDTSLVKHSWVLNEHITLNEVYKPSDFTFVFDLTRIKGVLRYNGQEITLANQATNIISIDNLAALTYEVNAALNADVTVSNIQFPIKVKHVSFTETQDEALCVTFTRKPVVEETETTNIEIVSRGLAGACLGLSTLIKPTELNIIYDDTEYTDADFTFYIVDLPSNGSIMLNDVAISAGGFFTLADVKNSLLKYNNTSTPDPLVDSFSFDLVYTDIAGATKTIAGLFSITIRECFRIIKSGPLTLSSAGETSPIDETLLLAEDQALAPSNISFRVTNTSKMTCGKLIFGADENTGIVDITQEQINASQLEYVHFCDATVTVDDEFEYTTTNGEITLQGVFKIIKSGEAPLVNEINTGITLPESTCKTITDDMLLYTKTGADPADIIYSITTNTTRGTMSKTTFSQQDIIDGKVKYCHVNNLYFSDSFKFIVSEGGTTTTEQTFSINITEITQPTLLNIGMELGYCRYKVITTEMLNLLEPPVGVTNTDIVFTVISVPDYPTQPVQILFNGVPLEVNDTFTKADIIAGSLRVKHTTLITGIFTMGFSWVAGVWIGTPADFQIDVVEGPLPSWMQTIEEFTVIESNSYTLTNEDIVSGDKRYCP